MYLSLYMPCKLCHQIGHNSRTCSSKKILLPLPLPLPLPLKKNYCYILQQKNKLKSLNYVGYTVNYNRRLRQHCGIIQGGAIYTKNRGPWEFLAILHCPTWDRIRALQVEWLIKHPTRKKKRLKCFQGSLGKIKSLIEIFHRIPKEETIMLYIHPTFYSTATLSDICLFKNVTLFSEQLF